MEEWGDVKMNRTTYIVVSNCGNVELNGTYTAESTDNRYGYTVYKNEQGAILIVYDDFSYMPPHFMKPNPDNLDLPEYQIQVWQASAWSTNGDVTSITSWDNFGIGISPTPTLTYKNN